MSTCGWSSAYLWVEICLLVGGAHSERFKCCFLSLSCSKGQLPGSDPHPYPSQSRNSPPSPPGLPQRPLGPAGGQVRGFVRQTLGSSSPVHASVCDRKVREENDRTLYHHGQQPRPRGGGFYPQLAVHISLRGVSLTSKD